MVMVMVIIAWVWLLFFFVLWRSNWQDTFVICTVIPLLKIFLFLLHDLRADIFSELPGHSLSEFIGKSYVLFENLQPVDFSYRIAFAHSHCLIDEHRPFIERTLISSDHIRIFKPEHILFNSINFISDLISAVIKKQNFILLVKLIYKDLVWIFTPWFKGLQNVDHEVLVFEIVPWVKSV
mgnify:CR=1 FL=1